MTPSRPIPVEALHGSAPARPPRISARQWLGLTVLVLPVLLVSVDMTVLSFAVPFISATLQPTGTQLLWIVDGYSLAIAGLLVLMGTLGDRFGHRKLLLIGGSGFGVVSLLAAFADTAGELIAARFALGIFGATLMPATLALLRNMFSDREQRRTAFAVWAAGFAGGAALGPIVGGWLLERFWWGSVFLMNVPVMLLLAVLAPLLVTEFRNPRPNRIDLLSAAMSILAMTGVVYGFKALADHGPGAASLGALGAGAALIVAFVRRQNSLSSPMLDMNLFRIPVFRTAVMANLMSVLGMTGMLFATAQYLQLVLGLQPVGAGLLLLPGAVASVIAGLAAARLARRYRLDVLIGSGLLLGAAGYVIVATLGSANVTRGAIQLAMAFVVLSVGAGLAETLTNDAILSTAPPERSGAASAISETAYEVGAVLGTTLLGSLLNAIYRWQIEVPTEASAAQADVARQTLGGAVQLAGQLPAGGEQLLESARAAFSLGMNASAVAGALLTVTAALIVWRTLRPAALPSRPSENQVPTKVGG